MALSPLRDLFRLTEDILDKIYPGFQYYSFLHLSYARTTYDSEETREHLLT